MKDVRVAVIDGDEIVYKCGFISQKKMHSVYIEGEEVDGWVASFPKKRDAIKWINEQEGLYIVEEVVPASTAFATFSARMAISDILRYSRCHTPLIAFSSLNNYRKKDNTFIDYKGNRSIEDRPIHYSTIKNYLLSQYPSISIDTLEADDIIGIYMADKNIKDKAVGVYEDEVVNLEYIGCSQDKDLHTVPGKLYDVKKGEVIEISEVEANHNLYIQMLTGDSADNVPGLSALCGRNCTANMKKHIKSLQTEKEMYDYVVSEYAKSYTCAEGIVERLAECLYIQRKLLTKWEKPDES